MAGVFRPIHRPPARRRRLLGAYTLAAQTGGTSAGVGTTAQTVKVAVCGGVTGIGGAPKGQAVKTVAHVGTGDVGASGSALDKKRATPVSASGAGVTGSATYARTSVQGGTSSAAVVTRSSSRAPSRGMVAVVAANTGLVKVVSVAGTLRAAVGLSSAGALTKTVSGTTGRVTAGPGAKASTAKIVEIGATERFFPVAYSTSPSRSSGATDAGLVAYGTAKRVAVVTGRACVGLSPAGSGRRSLPVRGVTGVGVSPRCTSRSKRAPVQGRACIGLWSRGEAIRSGATTGTRVSDPYPLPGIPPLGSLVLWETTTPPGTTVTVETSVDNGATWQVATNGRPIPRLPLRKTVARTIMTRTTLTRPTGSSPSPRVHRLELRVTVDASRVELVQLGRFLINECAISDSPEGLTIDIAGADLSRKVQRNRWERTYAYVAGIRTTDVIKMMIRSRFQACVFNFITTNDRIPTLFFGEQTTNDPWDDAQKLARDIGCDLFFDAYGVCTLRPTPDPAVDESSFEFDDLMHPTMTQLVRRITDEDTYNYVVVTGESSGNIRPVRASDADRDPASPTYVLGPYGTVTYRVASPAIVSSWQAFKAAQALLLKVKGATETVDFSAVPMPACEPGDVITVTRGRSRVEGQFTLQSIRMPLGAGEEMSATCRRQRY